MTWTEILCALLAVVLVGNILLLIHQRGQVRKARRDHANVRAEEERILQFSHALAEAFGSDMRSADLHRQIVSGAVKVVQATVGALYLADRSGRAVVPAFVTKGFPLFGEIPEQLRRRGEPAPTMIDAHVRLKSYREGEALVGSVWQSHDTLFLIDKKDLVPIDANIPMDRQATSLMATSLRYGDQNLGVLIVATTGKTPPLVPAEVPVFKSIAEQAAFALYASVMFNDAHEKRRMQNDLDIARDIQRILLPEAPPNIEVADISGLNIPARHVSGDYFDYIPVASDLTGVVIADVSGKGVPAALIMAMCRTVLRTHAVGQTSAAEVLRRTNRQLYPDIQEDMFISMAYLIINQRTRSVTFARAGHDAPLYRSASGEVRRLSSVGMALGIDSGKVFERVIVDHVFTLEPQDTLLLFTDGITEALDPDGDEFGVERLIRLLQNHTSGTSSDLIEKVSAEVLDFASRGPQHDDITLIAIQGR